MRAWHKFSRSIGTVKIQWTNVEETEEQNFCYASWMCVASAADRPMPKDMLEFEKNNTKNNNYGIHYFMVKSRVLMNASPLPVEGRRGGGGRYGRRNVIARVTTYVLRSSTVSLSLFAPRRRISEETKPQEFILCAAPKTRHRTDHTASRSHKPTTTSTMKTSALLSAAFVASASAFAPAKAVSRPSALNGVPLANG